MNALGFMLWTDVAPIFGKSCQIAISSLLRPHYCGSWTATEAEPPSVGAMRIQLLVAIFDYRSLAESAIEGAIGAQPAFADSLATLSIFDRMMDNTLMARMVQLDAAGKISDVSRKALSEGRLRALVPTRADWKVVASAFGHEFPHTVLNGEFLAFLEVMMLKRTSSVFFVPKDEDDASHFVSSMQPTASVVLNTSMTPEELKTLRVSLIASRYDETPETL